MQGVQGPSGQDGLSVTFRGAFSPNSTYTVNDVVSYLGSAYIALSVPVVGAAPDSSTAWALIVSKGDTGAAGAAGSNGTQGAQGVQGSQGVAGQTGPAGLAGTTGQSALTVFGTSSLSASAFVFADVPGLTQIITVPATVNGSIVYISTDGGVTPGSGCQLSSCSVVVDVSLKVDGLPLPHGAFQRVSVFDNAAVWPGPTGSWGIAQAVPLGPGSHTISVIARLAGQFNGGGLGLVSGGDGTITQGELSVLILNK